MVPPQDLGKDVHRSLRTAPEKDETQVRSDVGIVVPGRARERNGRLFLRIEHY